MNRSVFELFSSVSYSKWSRLWSSCKSDSNSEAFCSSVVGVDALSVRLEVDLWPVFTVDDTDLDSDLSLMYFRISLLDLLQMYGDLIGDNRTH